MGALLEQITEWLKGMLVDGIMNNLSGMFDAVNRQVADVASQVGSTPASFSPGVFALVRNISESVIIPIAGMFLTFIACYELIQLIIEHNNLANFETWIFFKWIFKTQSMRQRLKPYGKAWRQWSWENYWGCSCSPLSSRSVPRSCPLRSS